MWVFVSVYLYVGCLVVLLCVDICLCGKCIPCKECYHAIALLAMQITNMGYYCTTTWVPVRVPVLDTIVSVGQQSIVCDCTVW